MKDVAKFVASLLHDYKVSTAFPSVFQRGRKGSRVVVVTGDNASGKSLFAKLASEVLHHKTKIEPMLVGMAMRTQGGIVRAFVWGSEEESSTGCNSVQAILGGVRTARARERDHAMLFDEPDIGLSEGYQAAVGSLLAEFGASLPERTRMLLVVTHSRRIQAKLLPLEPHHVRFGDELTLREVVERTEPDQLPDELPKLMDRTREGMIKVSRLTGGKA